MTNRLPLFLFILLISCTSNPESQNTQTTSAEEDYENAIRMAGKSEFDSAMVYLRRSFAAGFDNPMQMTINESLCLLVEDSAYRPQVRDLLKEFSNTYYATMAKPKEEGERINVKGVIVDERTEQPLSGVKVFLNHADVNGLYFSEKSKFNPRIFAYLETDEQGRFEVLTIRPGNYKDDNDEWVPSHIHFSFEKDGYRPYHSEMVLGDDQYFDPDNNEEQLPVANATSGGEYAVTIGMQQE